MDPGLDGVEIEAGGANINKNILGSHTRLVTSQAKNKKQSFTKNCLKILCCVFIVLIYHTLFLETFNVNRITSYTK